MKLLDLFCGAGGAAMGYHRAGFDVVGVDIKPQPRYPFTFHQGDALEFCRRYGSEFDVIHASPPCQAYSVTQNLKTVSANHPDLVGVTRDTLRKTGKPYVIENVPGAPLRETVMLCGTMFDLGVIRHRRFECNPVLTFSPYTCHHRGRVCPMWWKSRREALRRGETFEYITVAGKSFLVQEARDAMKINWMTRDELAQAIPPAYTEWIGRRLQEVL